MGERTIRRCGLFAVLAAVGLCASGAVTVRPDAAVTVGEPLVESGVTSGGTWNVPADAVANIVAVEDGKGVDLVNGGREAVALAFDVAFADTSTQFDMRLNFPEVSRSVEEPGEAEAGTRVAVTLAEDSHGGIVFLGYSASGWTVLSGAGVVAETGRWYDLRIETREVGGAAYVSYLVRVGAEYVRLANGIGSAWFRLAGEGPNVSALAFAGDGRFADITGDRGAAEPLPVTADWVGGASGEWADAANWSRADEGGAPAAGDVVRVAGTVRMTRGDESATIRDGVFRVGEDGALTPVAGSLATPLAFDRSQVRIGQALRVCAAAFGGLAPPVRSCRWWRGDLGRNYAAAAVSCEASYTPTADDCEKWLRVAAEGVDGEALRDEFFVSRLPVLYLTTDDGATPSQGKEEHDGHVFVQGNGTDAKSFAGDSVMTIKVRGNTTSAFLKKPWKIKLAKKQKMFGIPKSKHWVLLANYNDESSMRNKLAYDFANEIGNLGMRSTWVECVLNGEWQGLYQFCEHIRIDENRVNVFDWEGEAEKRGESDEDFSWVDPETDDISGGYLFESSQEYDELTRFTITSGNLKLQTMLNSPEYLYTSQPMVDWCKGYLQKFCDATTSADGYAEGLHWSQYADLDSMATYFLVMEIFGNYDAVKKSRYFYKDRGALLKFGPVWDFDWSAGNISFDHEPTGWKVVRADDPTHYREWSECSFYREWADDPWFCTRLRTLYRSRARGVLARIVAAGGEIDDYKARLLEAGRANDSKWWRTRGFEAEADWLRNFLATRLAWLDAQFADVPTLMASLKAATDDVPSTLPYTADVATLPVSVDGMGADGTFVYRGQSPRVTFTVGGTTVTRVAFYVNGLKVGGANAKPVALTEDRRVSVKLPITMFTAGTDEENCISVVGYDANGQVVARNYCLATIDRLGAFVLRIR